MIWQKTEKKPAIKFSIEKPYSIRFSKQIFFEGLLAIIINKVQSLLQLISTMTICFMMKLIGNASMHQRVEPV